MALEAGSGLVEEGHVGERCGVDLSVLFGLGSPARRGGLLYWADTLGAAVIVQRLRLLESLGPRAQPTAMLLDMAKHAQLTMQQIVPYSAI